MPPPTLLCRSRGRVSVPRLCGPAGSPRRAQSTLCCCCCWRAAVGVALLARKNSPIWLSQAASDGAGGHVLGLALRAGSAAGGALEAEQRLRVHALRVIVQRDDLDRHGRAVEVALVHLAVAAAAQLAHQRLRQVLPLYLPQMGTRVSRCMPLVASMMHCSDPLQQMAKTQEPHPADRCTNQANPAGQFNPLVLVPASRFQAMLRPQPAC